MLALQLAGRSAGDRVARLNVDVLLDCTCVRGCNFERQTRIQYARHAFMESVVGLDVAGQLWVQRLKVTSIGASRSDLSVPRLRLPMSVENPARYTRAPLLSILQSRMLPEI